MYLKEQLEECENVSSLYEYGSSLWAQPVFKLAFDQPQNIT